MFRGQAKNQPHNGVMSNAKSDYQYASDEANGAVRNMLT
jgi:hypothetical protein